jgi:hypothetical protein
VESERADLHTKKGIFSVVAVTYHVQVGINPPLGKKTMNVGPGEPYDDSLMARWE